MLLLIAGVISVVLVSTVIVLGQWIITKNSAYAWTMAHLTVLLSVSIFFAPFLVIEDAPFLVKLMGQKWS